MDLPSKLTQQIGHWLSRTAATPAERAPVSAEAELVERLQRGETAAIDAAYRAHHQMLRAFAQRLVGEPSAAEDLVHDAFLALPKAMRNYRGESSLRTFLLGIAAQLSRRHIRSASRRRAMLERLRFASTESASLGQDDAQRATRARALSCALDTLPTAIRTTFVLHEVEQRTAGEVALILAIPEATVRTRCFHARKKLRELLEEGAP
jgi:RNA polymerase sigma-70 factor (ECF subfamily)